MKYTIRLSDNTVGTISSETPMEDHIGTPINVELSGENGNPIRKTGTLEEVLEAKEDWE